MWISPAFASDLSAASDVAASTGGPFETFVAAITPLLIIFLIFYFFLVRPQQKRIGEYQKMMAGLRRGDRIVTTGGIIGTVSKVDDKSPDVMLEIADGVVVRVQRTAIAEVLAKTGPVDSSAQAKKS